MLLVTKTDGDSGHSTVFVGKDVLIEIDATVVSATLLRPVFPRMVDGDLTHRNRGDVEKVCPIVPVRARLVDEKPSCRFLTAGTARGQEYS